jgi:hypothetical protein
MADPNDLINQTRQTAEVVEDALRSIASKVGDIFEDAVSKTDTFAKTLTKDITGSLNSLAKVSKQLEENQAKLTVGALKRSDIEKQILARKAKMAAIEDQINIAIKAGLIDEQEKENILAEHNRYSEELVTHLQSQAYEADKINKKLGLTGGILKGFSKIPILGGLIDSEKVLSRIQKEAGRTNSSKFSVFTEGVKGVGSSIMEGITSPFALATAGITALVKIFQFFIGAMFEADKRVTDIAKNFSISKDSARAQYEALIQTKGVLTTNLGLTKNIVEAFNELSSLSDFTYQASIKQLDTQIQLTKEIGIQAEEATQLQQLFTLNNNESDRGLDIIYDQIAAFANQNKIVADGRKIIADVNKLSGLIKLNFRGNTGEIVKTVLEAKKLGLTLDQITKTQSALLDFESSISSQIEAELLTGKQINLEKARLFVLNNDIAGLTEEIAKQEITAASFSRMNAIQQESIAKTLGMSAGELGDSLYKQELINKAGGKELKNKRDYIALLKQEGNLSEAARLEQELNTLEAGLVRGEALEDAQKSLDAQTKFTAALDQAKEIFSDLVTGGVLDSLSDILKTFINAIDKFNDSQGLKKQTLGPEQETTSFLGTGLYRETTSKDKRTQLSEVRPLGFLDPISETLGSAFEFSRLKVNGKNTEIAFGTEGLRQLLELQKKNNEMLEKNLNKKEDIVLNGEKVTNGFAKQTYALGSGN